MIDADLIDELLTPRFRIEPESFWATVQMRGDDRSDLIEAARQHGWQPISAWGRDGLPLGHWPDVVVYHRDDHGGFDLAEDNGGDLVVYRYPTRALREAATAKVALYHWLIQYLVEGAPWMDGVYSYDTMPEHLRGPFSRERLECQSPERSLE